MCGIAGTWGRAPGDGERARTSQMLAAMRHRGPDGEGMLEYPGGAAGMVRLALVDLSTRGQQPLWSPGRDVAILFNGEHYTFRAQRERLAANGYPFQTTTDTEVALALYLEHGLDFVDHLRGMYAFAIFDFRARGVDAPPTLVLGRDPLGIKPLFLVRTGGEDAVVFASELKGLLASGLVERAIDREGLASYLAHGFVVPPRTILRRVRQLDPGTIAVFEPNTTPWARRFWRTPAPAPRAEDLGHAAARLRDVIDDSIKQHSLADARVGAFLSGGVDSTGIVGVMRRHVSDLRTYTLAFPDVPGGDEGELAAAQAARFGCTHTTVPVEGTEVARLLPTYAHALDQPSTDGLNSWLIARAAAKECRAVLSGLGGDEYFAGYPVTRRMARTTVSSGRLVATAGQVAARLGLTSRLGRSLAARRSPLGLWLQTHGVFDEDEVGALAGTRYSPEESIRRGLDADEPRWREESAVGLSTLLDSRYYMGGQLLRDCDATTMSSSLELRVPFCDIEVFRCSRSIADQHKLAPGGGRSDRYGESGAKRVLVEALRDVLPDDILGRPKTGFALPLGAWLGGPLRSLVDEALAPETLRKRGLVDADAVAARVSPEDLPYPRAWSLVVLEQWARAYLDA